MPWGLPDRSVARQPLIAPHRFLAGSGTDPADALPRAEGDYLYSSVASEEPDVWPEREPFTAEPLVHRLLEESKSGTDLMEARPCVEFGCLYSSMAAEELDIWREVGPEEPDVGAEDGPRPERLPGRSAREAPGADSGIGATRRAPVAAGVLLAALAVCCLGVRSGVLRFRMLAADGPFEVKDSLWCAKEDDKPMPELWAPDVAGSGVQVKVGTYNLFWWNLFDRHGGRDGQAGKLLAEHHRQRPFDFVGFQECQDPSRVMQDGGLQDELQTSQADNGLCMAFRKADWHALAEGQEALGEDQPGNYWGKRSVQWMRLQSVPSGKVVFFMNHHGPLEIDSGGICGGGAVAFRLLQVVADNAQRGDAVVLVGDFNARMGSNTVEQLSQRLTRVFTGDKFGGIDHFFSNVAGAVSTENLGGGGSDHDALAVVLEIGAGAPVGAAQDKDSTTTTATSQTDTSTTATTATTQTDTLTTVTTVTSHHLDSRHPRP